MSGPESCREAARLQKMLEGTLPPDEQATVAEHLEKCPACQVKYEELSASMRLIPEGSEKPPGPGETALHEVMERLAGERPPAASEGPASAAEEISLSFLSPPEHPGHLGRLGPYEIIEVIGQGGMGVVLKGRDPRLNRFVAVKVLAPQLAANAAARRRFTREARAAAAVSHNHVVTIHSVDEVGGFPYLVMEYVAGCSLADRLSRTGPLELRETLRIGLQVASGLAAAHAHGLIHRDIKPANILMEDSVERVKITDFGLARAVDDVQVTRSGQVCGTPEYMSPEQARGQAVDQRSDLFSLGCVLYAMCAGRSPFRADSSWDAVNRVCNDAPRPLREVNTETPPWLTDLIGKLLAKNPEDRIQSAAEVAGLLERQLARLQHPQSGPDSTTTAEIQWTDQPGQQPAAKSRRDRWAGAVLALVALAVILGMTEATGMTQLAATVIRILRPEGTLEIAVDDPSIKVTIDGEEVAIDGAGPQEVRLRLGQHQLQATKDGKAVHQELVTITRAGKQVVKVALTPQEQAQGHRQPDSKAPEVKAAEPPAKVSTPVAPTQDAVREIRRLESDPPAWASSVAVSHDGRYALSGGDNTVRLWDVATGRQLQVFRGHETAVNAVALSPDGRLAISSSEDGTVRIWDPESGKEVRRVDAHAFRVRGMALSPDGRRVVSCCFDWKNDKDHSIRLWDVPSGRKLREFEQVPFAPLCVAFSPDGRQVLAGLVAGSALGLWAAETGQPIRRFGRRTTDAVCAAFSPDGRLAVSGHLGERVEKGVWQDKESCVVRLWDVEGGHELRRLQAHTAPVLCVAFSPSGRFIASASGASHNALGTFVEAADKTIRFWDVETGEEAYRLNPGETVQGLAFTSDGRFLLSGGREAFLRLWDLPERLRAGRTKPTSEIIAQAKPAGPEVAAPSPPPKGGAPVERLRKWSDASGQFSVQARLVDASDGKVVLDREDGKRITVEVNKLTAEDQKYVASQRPEHQGKSLKHWIALSRRPEPQARFEALTALKQMAAHSEPAQRALEAATRTEAIRCIGAMRVLEAIGPHAKAAAPALGNLLRNEGEDPAFRTMAAQVLGKIGPAAGPAVPDLVEALGDKQESIRLAAAQALAQIGAEAKPAVPVLIQLLSSPDLQLRRAAARALAHRDLQTKNAIPALTELLKHDIPWLRAEAAVTLSKMGPDTAKLAIPTLTAAVPDQNACAALAALGPETAKIGIPPLIAALARDLQSGYGRIDREAIQALRDAGPEAVKAAVPVILPLLRNQDKRVRSNASSVLTCLGPAAESALPELKAMMTDKDAQIRSGALGPLWGMGSPAIPIFIELLGHAEASVRHSAAFHLGRFGEHIDNNGRYAMVAYGIRVFSDAELKRLGQEAKAAVPALVERLRDDNSDVFFQAALALRRIDPQGSAKAALPLLVARLREANWNTRRAAIETLEKMRPESNAAIPVLTELLGDKDLASRCDAARVLAKMGAEPRAKAVGARIQTLRDPDKRSRIAAIMALGQIGAEAVEAAPALTEILADADKEVRAAAATALGKMGPQAAKAAMPVLMGLLADEDGRVSQGAAWAILTMGPEGAEAGVPIVVGSMNWMGHTGGILPWLEESFRQTGPDLVPALARILEDREPSVRRVAMQAMPDKRSRTSPGASDSPQPENRQPAIPEPLNQSLNNLKQIGLAIHNFHDTYKHFPPAVIYGPDGKPWHSWRVLVLPFIGHATLYQKYRFDEPWDGPHNKALLDAVPPVYRDPVHPGSKDAFTHYAAITGPGTAFPLEPRKPVSFLRSPAGLSAATTSIGDIRDGTSNTVLAGSIGPDRKIPWTKPEDVPWSDGFPGLGKPGSFATPHKFEDRPAAVLLRADGSAAPMREDLDPAELSKLLQIADRSAPAKPDPEKPKLRNVPGLLQEGARTSEQAVPTYHGHGGPVLAACFSPDGKRLASAGYDQTIHVWNAMSSGGTRAFSTVCVSVPTASDLPAQGATIRSQAR